MLSKDANENWDDDWDGVGMGIGIGIGIGIGMGTESLILRQLCLKQIHECILPSQPSHPRCKPSTPQVRTGGHKHGACAEGHTPHTGQARASPQPQAHNAMQIRTASQGSTRALFQKCTSLTLPSGSVRSRPSVVLVSTCSQNWPSAPCPVPCPLRAMAPLWMPLL